MIAKGFLGAILMCRYYKKDLDFVSNMKEMYSVNFDQIVEKRCHFQVEKLSEPNFEAIFGNIVKSSYVKDNPKFVVTGRESQESADDKRLPGSPEPRFPQPIVTKVTGGAGLFLSDADAEMAEVETEKTSIKKISSSAATSSAVTSTTSPTKSSQNGYERETGSDGETTIDVNENDQTREISPGEATCSNDELPSTSNLDPPPSQNNDDEMDVDVDTR